MRVQLILSTVVALSLGLAATAEDSSTKAKASVQTLAAFERIKSLAGAWEGEYSGAKGAIKHARYDVVSNGTAVILMMDWGSTGNMATVFHLDGDAIMATHYCPVGNQPRMRAMIADDGNVIHFQFQDATGLSDPSDWHMRHLRLVFDGSDQHTLHWTYLDNGKEEIGTFRYTRSRNRG